jgi:CRISPR-associated endonuclease/helicase Cas3
MVQETRQALAKSRTLGNEQIFLPLIDHSADVAAVFEALLALPSIAARMERLVGRALLQADSQRLCALVALHDAGKVNVGFQNKITRGDKPHAGHIAPLVSLMDDELHGESGAKKNYLRNAFQEAIGFADMETWRPSGVMDAILAHHGWLPEPGPVDSVLWQTRSDYDPFAALAELRQAIGGWFPDAFSAVDHPLPSEPRFLHALAGLVILADWLGSDDGKFRFPSDDAATGSNRMGYSRQVAAEVLRDRFLNPLAWRSAVCSRLFDFDTLFPDITPPRCPRWPQKAMLQAPLPDPGSGRVVVLESETGSGKTEAALIHFMQLFRNDCVDGMYFALPTRAAALQIQKRIHTMLQNYLGAEAPPVGLAVPGYLRVDDADAMKLPDYDVLWPDDDNDEKHDRGWACEHPKRYLAGAVMVGTVDQLLLGALRVRHAHLRSAPMLRLLLVVDEVHASDAYMEALLRRVLNQHLTAGGHALLLSATLGSAARLRLMTAQSSRRASDPPAWEDAAAIAYPCCWIGGSEPLTSDAEGTPKEVAIELLDLESANPALLAERALAAARGGARVMMIRNRVSDAQALQRALLDQTEAFGERALLFACRGYPAPHHARFAAEDRRLLDEALERAFGKGSSSDDSSSDSGVVAVTTQTAEQSLDIDADLMITDLCPADVLLQRIGRLHRHEKRRRPPGYETARLIVLTPSLESLGKLAGQLQRKGDANKNRPSILGLGKIYPDLVGIAATRQFLSEEGGFLRIPQQNRAFVEAATHPERLETLAHELGAAWENHRQDIKGKTAANRVVATMNAIDWNKRLTPPWPGDAKCEEQIRTRLGLDTRHVVLDPPMTGPFGEKVQNFPIPAWMIETAPPDNKIAANLVKIGGDNALEFSFGGRLFRYSLLGLEQG